MNTIKKQAVTTYTDCRYRPTELTQEEQNWFYSLVDQAKHATGCKVEILPYDHDLFDGKSKDALGCCITNMPDSPLSTNADTFITIDCYFIHECFRLEFYGEFTLESQTIPEVIAHEIAHLFVWRHGKKHTAKTQELLKLILDSSCGRCAA